MSEKVSKTNPKSEHFLRRTFVLALFPFVGFAAVLFFAAVLISLRLEKSVGDLIEDRAALIALQLADVVEGGLRFGVPLSDQAAVPGKMRSLISNDEGVLTVSLFSEKGKRLMTEDRDGKVPDIDPRIVQRVLSQQRSNTAERYSRTWRTGGEQHVIMQSRDALGFTGGVVWIIYSATSVNEAFSKTIGPLLSASAAMLAGSLLLIFGFVMLIWRSWEDQILKAHWHLGGETAVDGTSAMAAGSIPGMFLKHVVQSISSAEDELKAIERKMMEKAL